MTVASPAPSATPAVTAPAPRTGSPQALADVRSAGLIVAVLLVVGAALGPLWAWWSPDGPAAVLYPHNQVLPDESENWIAADGRFMVIAAAVGLLAALTAWWFRAGSRGAITAFALAVGGVGGALLMDLTGSLAGGGDNTGKYRVQLTDGSVRPYTKELPIWVHATGLLVLEAAVAVLVYALLVAFTTHDDLGRPDPVRERLRPEPQFPQQQFEQQPVPPLSVDAGGDAQHGRRDGDAPGAAQQGEFPTQ